jgi:hypothetical protein
MSAAASESPWRPSQNSPAGRELEIRVIRDPPATRSSKPLSKSSVRTSRDGLARNLSTGAPPRGASPPDAKAGASTRISSTGEAPSALKRSSSGGWPNASSGRRRSNGGKGQPGHSLEHSSRREQGTKKTVRHPPLGLTRSSSAENAFELSLWKKNSGLMQSRLLAVKQLTIHVTKHPVVESEDDAPTSRGLSQACVSSRPKSHSLPGRLGPHELEFAHEVARKLQTACTVKCTRQASNSQHLVAQHGFKFIFAALVASVLSLILVSPKLLV